MVNATTLIDEYRRRFPGSEPEVIARAPGRVNLIGEHVDYNGGLVMPFAIPLATWAVAGRREDARIIAQSAQVPGSVEFESQRIGEPMAGWGCYVQGVIASLQQLGLPTFGMNILIDSDIPVGAGLSSSAALEAAVALAALELAGQSLSRSEIASACRVAEHNYAKVPCGIMDQTASLCAHADHVLLLDCRDNSIAHIPWTRQDIVIVIVDSRSPHRLSAGTYAERVRECSLVAARSSSSWRELKPPALDAIRNDIGKTVYRRARHVITEIARVRDAADALQHPDFPTLGRLMNESHQSLAEDYEVSTPRLDTLAACIRGVPGVFGARLTGAGFGGCVVAVAEQSATSAIESAVRRDYDPHFNVTAPVWTWCPSEGATIRRVTS